jgi:RNA polymerase sigma-70 factor (ECF subfamily)
MQRASQPGEAAAEDINTLLRAWSDGDQSALEQLTPVVYDEFHRLARRYMKGERSGHSLQTTRSGQ